MLKVGKKYSRIGSNATYECIFTGNSIVVLRDSKGYEVSTATIGLWKEYKEPKTIRGYIPVFRRDGKVWFGQIRQTNWMPGHRAVESYLVDWVEVSYTEKEENE